MGHCDDLVKKYDLSKKPNYAGHGQVLIYGTHLRIYVTKACHDSEGKCDQSLSPAQHFPKSVDGHPVEIIEIGEIKPL